jgi:hypothetical protein
VAGTRTPVEISDTIAGAWQEILDALADLPARYIGPGPSDETTTIGKTIRKADAKNELDAIAYLDGCANIESQGRIKAVRILHDDPADEAPVFALPLGSYEPLEIGPGFDARTDEFFTRFNYDEARQDFDDEIRHFNAAAITSLGGSGLNATQDLRDEVCQWIRTEALADAVGRRVVNHFGTGEILWHVAPKERMPHIEIGDVGSFETDMFVARSPINGRELRGPLSTLAIVVGVDDPMGGGMWLWVPSYELMTASDEGVTRSGFGVTPDVADLTYSFNTDSELVVSMRGVNAGSVKVAADASSFPNEATVDGESVQALTSGEVQVNLGSGFPSAVFLSAKAFENADGTGAASDVRSSRVFRVEHLEAATGTFAGALSAATGTFSGSLSAADGEFTGSLSRGGIEFGPLHVDATERDTAANTSEQTLETITVPAGAMGTGGGVRLKVIGITNGNNDTKTVRIRFGGESVAFLTVPAAAATRFWEFDTHIFALGSATDQRILTFNHANFSFTWGFSNLPTWTLDGDVDTSSDVDITVTMELDNASDSGQVRLTTAELIAPGA